MLEEFLTTNRAVLIDRCKSRVAERLTPETSAEESDYGVPLFLDQIVRTLQGEMPVAALKRPDVSLGGNVTAPEMEMTAQRHGLELLRRGYTVEQVVRDYGDLCQEITGLAMEVGAPIAVDEFQILNRCLDDGIADAVTEFTSQRDMLTADNGSQAMNERIGFLAHELRNFLNTASLALTAIKSGRMGLSGSTGGVLERSLLGMRNLLDRALSDVRLTAGLRAQQELVSVSGFIAQVQHSAELEAKARGCEMVVPLVDPSLAVYVDRDMLFSVVGNLLQNAFKFTRPHTEVQLRAYAADPDRVLISVGDRCGGLPSGDTERMFLPFTQGGMDKSGLGLGLTICRRSIEANNGTLTVRDVPGSGCIFTIDLPRCALA